MLTIINVYVRTQNVFVPGLNKCTLLLQLYYYYYNFLKTVSHKLVRSTLYPFHRSPTNDNRTDQSVWNWLP
jgi:hypothetical protein